MFGVVFLVLLYAVAATASLYDTYQPGIEAARHRFHPIVWLFLWSAIPIALGTLLGREFHSLVRFGARIAWIALAIALILDVSICASVDRFGEWFPPQGVQTTLVRSLTNPDFSNRSYFVPTDAALVAGMLVIASSRAAKSPCGGRLAARTRGPRAGSGT